MGAYEDYLAKQGGGAAPAATATAPATGAYAAYLAKHGGGNPEMDRARNRSSAPQGTSPFGRVSMPELPPRTGDAVLEGLKRPGNAMMAAAAEPDNLGTGHYANTALNALLAGRTDAQHESDRDAVKTRLGVRGLIDKLPAGPVRGTADTGVDMLLDPFTVAGGSGALERGANALGRTAYIGAAKGMAHANPVSRAAGVVHDFVTPGGAEMGQLKRTLAAKDGRKGLDTYVTARSAAKGAANAGTDPVAAVSAALSKPKYKPGSVPGKPQYVGSTPPDQSILDAFKPQQGFTGGGRVGEVARGVSKGAKAVTKGATDLMFAAPQLPLMEGHGSNVLQTALLSDPMAAGTALARFAASGEAIPHSGVRNFVQKLPGVRDLKKAQDASIARADASGANTVHPEDFGSGGWLSKIPGVGMAARESNRGLQGWDAAVKGSLNDKFTREFERQGYTPKVAQAKAADRVAQDVVDYSDKSDWNRAVQHLFPFGTYATKKPGIIARAVARHPERVLAMTRNNPNFQADRDEPMGYPDQGRPLSSVFNAANNKSPGGADNAPFPGAQYVRGAAGAPINDLLGAAGAHYFTHGDPGKHGDGDPAMGWLKLLLSQTVGNAPFVGDNPIPGHKDDSLLSKLGLNYFGGR